MPIKLRERRHRSRLNVVFPRNNLLEGRLSIINGVCWNISVRQTLRRAVNPGQREEELDAWLGDCFSCCLFDRRRARLGVSAGTAFAAAKIIFVLALLAFLISAVVEVSRRGAPYLSSGPANLAASKIKKFALFREQNGALSVWRLGMLIMNAARVSKFEKPGPAPDVPAEVRRRSCASDRARARSALCRLGSGALARQVLAIVGSSRG